MLDKPLDLLHRTQQAEHIYSSVYLVASSNKCLASSNRCLTSSNKKLLVDPKKEDKKPQETQPDGHSRLMAPRSRWTLCRAFREPCRGFYGYAHSFTEVPSSRERKCTGLQPTSNGPQKFLAQTPSATGQVECTFVRSLSSHTSVASTACHGGSAHRPTAAKCSPTATAPSSASQMAWSDGPCGQIKPADTHLLVERGGNKKVEGTLTQKTGHHEMKLMSCMMSPLHLQLGFPASWMSCTHTHMLPQKVRSRVTSHAIHCAGIPIHWLKIDEDLV